MGQKLVEKNALITGGAAGIGNATALRFAEEGAAVVIADLNRAAGQAVADQIVAAGGRARFIAADVSNAEQVQGLVAAAADFLGAIDVVVNNAGIQICGPLAEFTADQWDALMTVNVRSCFLVTQAALRHLRQRPGAAVVNVGSVAGFRGGAGGVAYAASKGAIIGFSRAVAQELIGDGIRVNCVCPGWIDTPFNQPIINYMGGRERQAAAVSQGVPMGRQGTPQEIAAAIVFLASDESSYMTGQNLVVDGGAS